MRPRSLLVATLFAVLSPLAEAQVSVYHGVSSATHQAQFNTLSAAGYRPLSISVSGGLSSPAYSAVWAVRTGPSWLAVHDMTPAQFSTFYSTQISAGYKPFHVSAAGSGTNTVFAGIFVFGHNSSRNAVFEVGEAGLATAVANNRGLGLRLRTLEAYGTSASPRFVGTFEEAPDGEAWDYTVGMTATEYQQQFNAYTSGRVRPAFVDISDFQTYCAVWRDDSIGPWTGLSGLTGTAFQTEVNNRPGEFPLFLQAGGSGTAIRWTTVFCTSDAVLPRTTTITGTSVPSMAMFDTYAIQHLQAMNARGAAIAVARHGRLVFARGYTWAEAGYPTIQPTGMFRLASCTKPVAALAAHVLDRQSTSFSLNTTPATQLSLASTDSRFQQVQVRHAIQHSSGIARDTDIYAVASWVNPLNPTFPVSTWNTLRYSATTQSLMFNPGTNDAYSNVAYQLLGQSIAAGSLQTFETFVRNQVAAPLGITRMWLTTGTSAGQRTGEVPYHGASLDLYPSQNHADNRPVLDVHTEDIARLEGAGALITSAVDYVRLLSGAYFMAPEDELIEASRAATALQAPAAPLSVDLGGFAYTSFLNGLDLHGKSGTLQGTSTQVTYRSDGIAIAAFVNKSNSHMDRNQLNNFVDQVTSWPTHDLFPSYGLTSFQPTVPRVDSVSPAAKQQVNVGAPFRIRGSVLGGVTRVDFGSRILTSQNPSNWATGYYRIVDSTTVDVYPPQGLAPGAYTIRLRSGTALSGTLSVNITTNTSTFLGGPTTATSPFELVLARGTAPANALVFLGLSFSNQMSVVPGVIALDIGNQFAELITWPGYVTFDAVTGCARWPIPAFGPGPLHVQAVTLDPANPTPVLVPTNSWAVSGQ